MDNTRSLPLSERLMIKQTSAQRSRDFDEIKSFNAMPSDYRSPAVESPSGKLSKKKQYERISIIDEPKKASERITNLAVYASKLDL